MAGNETSAVVRQARQVLVAQRRELVNDLKRLDALIAAMDAWTNEPALGQRQPGGPSGKGPQQRRRGVLKPALLEILRESGRIMHADEITEEVERRGVPLSAKDPKPSIVSALIRMAADGEGVVKLGGNRFRAADQVANTGVEESADGNIQPEGTTLPWLIHPDDVPDEDCESVHA